VKSILGPYLATFAKVQFLNISTHIRHWKKDPFRPIIQRGDGSIESVKLQLKGCSRFSVDRAPQKKQETASTKGKLP